MNRERSILHVSTSDRQGGAEKIGWLLFEACAAAGWDSWMVVGTKHSADPRVFSLDSKGARGHWESTWLAFEHRLSTSYPRFRGRERLREWMRTVASPSRSFRRWLGHEEFNFPASRSLLHLAPRRPDIIQCHNLHGEYFDLRTLPELSRQLPVTLTLHDAWLLTGHCAHSFQCERWVMGCGQCPDLSIYPYVRRDATARNWRVKQAIYAKSRLFIVTPSRWLMDKVERSMLAPTIVQSRIIPNGIDLEVIRPGDRAAARAALGLSHDAFILLYTGINVRNTPWRDPSMLRKALARLTGPFPKKIVFVMVGDAGSTADYLPDENIELRLVPFQSNPERIADYYRAADLFVHPAKDDTYPTVVLESLACGTPVIATAVGGIPEQVRTLSKMHGPDSATGLLVPRGDSEAMASALQLLINDTTLRLRLAENAQKDAAARFGKARELQAYLEWYETIRETHRAGARETIGASSISL